MPESALFSFPGPPRDDFGYLQKMAGSGGPHQFMVVVRPYPPEILFERLELLQGARQPGLVPLESDLPGHDCLPLPFKFLPTDAVADAQRAIDLLPELLNQTVRYGRGEAIWRTAFPAARPAAMPVVKAPDSA